MSTYYDLRQLLYPWGAEDKAEQQIVFGCDKFADEGIMFKYGAQQTLLCLKGGGL